MELLNVALLCATVFAVGVLATKVYLTKTAVGAAAQAEIARHYGTDRMREFLGKTLFEFSEDVRKTSPIFCEIYVQAQMAEQEGYSQICGLGYGKALEFLIKDYAISLNSTDAEAIKKVSLSECIKNHIPDDELRNSADLARWLRNDETHYLRKFESTDASDLRGLIDIAGLLIQQAQLKVKIAGDIQERREMMEKARAAK